MILRGVRISIRSLREVCGHFVQAIGSERANGLEMFMSWNPNCAVGDGAEIDEACAEFAATSWFSGNAAHTRR